MLGTVGFLFGLFVIGPRMKNSTWKSMVGVRTSIKRTTMIVMHKSWGRKRDIGQPLFHGVTQNWTTSMITLHTGGSSMLIRIDHHLNHHATFVDHECQIKSLYVLRHLTSLKSLLTLITSTLIPSRMKILMVPILLLCLPPPIITITITPTPTLPEGEFCQKKLILSFTPPITL